MKRLLFILIMINFTILLAGDGWVIYEKDSEGNITKTFTDGRRISHFDEESGFRSIVDLKTMKMTMINVNEKTYWQGTWKEFSEGTKKLMEDAQKKALENVPEAYREQMKAMMGGGSVVPSGKGKLVKAGSEKIGSYNAEKYQLKFNGKTFEDIWVSDDLPFWGTMSKYTKNISKDTWEFFGENEFAKKLNFEIPVEYFMLHRDYYQVKKITHMENPMMGGTMTFSEELDHVESKSLGEDIFSVPAGFKKTDMKGVMKIDFGSDE